MVDVQKNEDGDLNAWYLSLVSHGRQKLVSSSNLSPPQV